MVKLRIVNNSAESTRTNFSFVHGMEDLKAMLRVSMIEPLLNQELYAEIGLVAGDKYLMFGPPGCGKSLIAMAIAGEANATFYRLTPSNTLARGDQIGTVARLFEEARHAKPSVIVLDEAEALTENRDTYSNSASMRAFIDELLLQFDDTIHDNTVMLMIGTTNTPWYIDNAFIRPGRFGNIVFVPPPDLLSRIAYIKHLLHPSVLLERELEELAAKTKGFSFADIMGLVKHAKQIVIKKFLLAKKEITSAAEIVLTMPDLREAINGRVSSVDLWFKQFNSHGDQIHSNLRRAVNEYHRNSRAEG
jgi:SpoVK/Ycf46/Vps4 family AAA+-type ATPase